MYLHESNLRRIEIKNDEGWLWWAIGGWSFIAMCTAVGGVTGLVLSVAAVVAFVVFAIVLNRGL